MKKFTSLAAASALVFISLVGILPSANAFVGTLENGNLAYAQSEFNKGEACNYLPGFETGYDAWHFVLTTRGATFQKDSLNPLASINLNFVFMRQDNSLFTIRTGAWVQTGKGAYVYTLVSDRIRMVQVGSLAKIDGADSGIRLSHTCPGTGSPTNLTTTNVTPTPTPTASPSPTASPTPTATKSASPSPTPTTSSSPTPTASPSPTVAPSPSPSPTVSPTPTASPSPTAISIPGKYIGTLENGDGAPADSSFNKGEACIYLPGYESGYDAWHFVLTTRGATFQQDPSNAAKSINLNFIFKRTDGSTFVIKQGAWVQTGKGAYVYTLTKDKNMMVQAGSYAELNPSLSSGMRLSHTCPGTGAAVTAATPTPTPTPTPTATKSATPTPAPTASPSAPPSPSPSKSASPTPTPTLSPTPSPTPSATATPCPCDIVITKLKKVLPTPKPSKQPIPVAPTPTPSAEASPSSSPSPSASPSPSSTRSATPNPSGSPTPTYEPPVLPTPPSNIDPKEILYVDPQKPPTVDPQKFPEPPASPVVVTESPKWGELKENPNGTFTYLPNEKAPDKPTVDEATFQYTTLSGATVVVRKQFILVEKGDVPSIIQTGYGPISGSQSYLLLLLLPIALAIRVARKGRTNA